MSVLKWQPVKLLNFRFYDLDGSKSLVWNLQNKIVIEHPIIYAIFKDHFDYFRNGLTYSKHNQLP